MEQKMMFISTLPLGTAFSTELARVAKLSTQMNEKPQVKDGIMSQQHCLESTLQDFIMSRFQRIT